MRDTRNLQRQINVARYQEARRQELLARMHQVSQVLQSPDCNFNDPRFVKPMRAIVAEYRGFSDDQKRWFLASTDYLDQTDIWDLCNLFGLDPVIFLNSHFLEALRQNKIEDLVDKDSPTSPLARIIKRDDVAYPIGTFFIRYTPKHWDGGIDPDPKNTYPANRDGHCAVHSVANAIQLHAAKNPLFLELVESRRDVLDIAERRAALKAMSADITSVVFASVSITDIRKALVKMAGELVKGCDKNDTYLAGHLADLPPSPSAEDLADFLEKLCVRASLDGAQYDLLLQQLAAYFPALPHSAVTAMTTPGIGTFTQQQENGAATLVSPLVTVSA